MKKHSITAVVPDNYRTFSVGTVSGGANHKGHGKIAKVMHEFKAGTLHSSSGQKVTNPKQAIAIGISEAKKAGEKIHSRKKKY